VLNGVACPSTKSCFAVGDYPDTSTTTKTLVEHWNGSHWAIMPSANPSHAIANLFALSAVSCPSTKSCFAVGNIAGMRALVEHWNGTSWGLMGTANASSQAVNQLSGVSCPSTKSCFAVGDMLSRGLVEHWNGSGWTAMTNPTDASWSGVACPSTKSCFAVGTSAHFVAHWNGHTWATMSIAVDGLNPAEHFDFKGASCPSTHRCLAVGSYSAHAPAQTLVAQYK